MNSAMAPMFSGPVSMMCPRYNIAFALKAKHLLTRGGSCTDRAPGAHCLMAPRWRRPPRPSKPLPRRHPACQMPGYGKESQRCSAPSSALCHRRTVLQLALKVGVESEYISWRCCALRRYMMLGFDPQPTSRGVPLFRRHQKWGLGSSAPVAGDSVIPWQTIAKSHRQSAWGHARSINDLVGRSHLGDKFEGRALGSRVVVYISRRVRLFWRPFGQLCSLASIRQYQIGGNGGRLGAAGAAEGHLRCGLGHRAKLAAQPWLT